MKTIRIQLTQHALNDRMDRLMEIAMTIGWGEPCLEVEEETNVYVITSTGVVLVKNLEGKLITAYVGSIQKVFAIYRSHGYNELPYDLMTTVIQNSKRKWKYNLC